MRLPIDRIENGAPWHRIALPGTGLTLLGAAALAMACAVLGIAIPQAMPGETANDGSAAAVTASIKRLSGDDLSPLLGKEVHSASGDDIGRVAGILVDGASEPRAVIVKVGGFLGIGVRSVAVDWQNLRVQTAGEGEVVLADLALQQVAQAPQYRPGSGSVAVVSAPGAGADAANLGDGE